MTFHLLKSKRKQHILTLHPSEYIVAMIQIISMLLFHFLQQGQCFPAPQNLHLGRFFWAIFLFCWINPDVSGSITHMKLMITIPAMVVATIIAMSYFLAPLSFLREIFTPSTSIKSPCNRITQSSCRKVIIITDFLFELCLHGKLWHHSTPQSHYYAFRKTKLDLRSFAV